MSVAVGTLTIDLRANTASFQQSMDKMSQLSAKTATDIKKSLEKITVAGMAMAAAVAAGTGALIRSALDTADAMGKLAQSAGTTVETLSVLNYAAGLSNVSMEQLGKGLEKLSQASFKVQNGNVQLQRVFQRLGVTVLDANGHLKDSGILMEELAVKFSGMADNSAAKPALAMQLFGKSGAALIPMLNQYGAEQAKVNEEAHQFGLILTSSTSEVAQKAHDNLDRLGFVLKGVGFSVLNATLPALDALLQKIIEIAKNANIPDLAKSFGESATRAIELFGDALEFATKHVILLKNALIALAAVQVGKFLLPVIADLAAGGIGKLGEGFSKFVLSATGFQRVTAGLPKIGTQIAEIASGFYGAAKGASVAEIASLGMAQGFGGVAKVFAALKGLSIASIFTGISTTLRALPALLSTIAAGALNVGRALMLAALSNPWTIALAAIAALIALMYKFRDATFSLNGTTYQLRDTWNAAFIIIGKAVHWIGDEFKKLINGIKSLWHSFIEFIGANSIIKILAPMFTGALEWIGRMLGKLTPQWAINALNEAKAEREAAAAKQTAATPTGTAGTGGKTVFDTSGLGKQTESPVDLALANLQEKLRASQQTLAAAGLEAEAQRKVNAENEANNEILKLGEAIAKQTGARTKDFASLVDAKTQATIRSTVAQIAENKALSELRDIIGNQTRATALSIEQSERMIAVIDQGADAIARQTALAQAQNELVQKGASDQEIQTRAHEIYTENLAKEAVEAKTALSNMQDQIAERKILNAGLLGNVDAQRRASLQAKLYALDQKIAKTATGALRDELIQQRQAIIDLTDAENKQADIENALQLRSPIETYERENETLERAAQTLAQLQGGMLTYGQQLTLAAKAQDEFNRVTDETINLLLRFGGLKDGVAAFFLEMQEKAITAAQIIFDALNQTFEKLSDNLTQLITGGKTNFAKMFEDIGRSMVKQTIQSAMQKGISALGKAMGVSIPTRYDGQSATTALFVQIARGAGVAPGGGGFGSPLTGGSNGPMSNIGGAPSPFGGGILGGLLGKLFGANKSSAGNGIGMLTGALPQGAFGASGNGLRTRGILGDYQLYRAIFGGGQDSGSSDGGIGSGTPPFLPSDMSSGASASGGFLGSLFKFIGSIFGQGAAAARATGGSVSPSSAYIVGEQGPEILTGVSGNIMNNTASRRVMSGIAGPTVYYSIDARGTDPAQTEQRTRAAIIAAHNSAVVTGVQADVERTKRIPYTSYGKR